MHQLAERLLNTIRKQESIRPGDRLAAAVSGGADSVGLLRLLLELREELGIVLSVAHVNHRLRAEESDEEERFVANLAQQHRLELHACDAPVAGKSRSGIRSAVGSANPSGIEAAARELRYHFFRQMARDGRVTKVATAHTLDDQAETVLLRIFRGTGIRGLSGIHPRIVFEAEGRPFGELLRPLLGFRHSALQAFLREQGQPWREDSSNRNVAFLRNRLRHQLLPMIAEDFGDAAIEHMSELAEIARAEDDHWTSGHPEICPHISGVADELPLPAQSLLALPLAAQRRLTRKWLETNAPDLSVSFRLIEETLQLARGEAGRKLELPGRRYLRRERQKLLLDLEPFRAGEAADYDYEYILDVPGAIKIPELGVRIEAQTVDANGIPETQRDQLLDPARMPKEIVIRNWRAGDRFWPAHTAAAKKVKDLLSKCHAIGSNRKLWPVAVADGRIVWMRGFAVPTTFQAPARASQAIRIRELPS